MGKIISLDRSIIPACDVRHMDHLEKIVDAAKDFKQVRAYKIGFSLGLRYGLPYVVKAIKDRHPGAVVIYDHQKAATDIPHPSAEDFADTMAYGGIDAAIIFPMSGPVTQSAFIDALRSRGIGVISGGEMTHPSFKLSEGGYIDDKSLERMYALSAEMKVEDFVVPGNRVDRIGLYRNLIESKGIAPVFYSPGLVTQGGDISEAAKAAGSCWHAICGRAVYNPDNKDDLDDVTIDEMRSSIANLVKNLAAE